MNPRYTHTFIGSDDVENRMDILWNNSGASVELEAQASPVVLKYQNQGKLNVVNGSQATLNLMSDTSFQFADLHTEDAKTYQVRLYRNNKIFWMGWLDTEMYNEDLSTIPPYGVSFTASDFNLWKRLKYTNTDGKAYTDVATMFQHLTRCINTLELPFGKLYIGCSTTAEGITATSAQTALHVLYVQSANFYDEDGEAMSCREVVESLLKPFGMIMVQRDGNIYIADYNTIANNLPMKRYGTASWTYETEETVDWKHGDMDEIGFSATGGEYGYEEMYNNVTVTSSIYADTEYLTYNVEEGKLEDEAAKEPGYNFSLYKYRKCVSWSGSSNYFLFFDNEENGNTLLGAEFKYTADSNAANGWKFKPGDIFFVAGDKRYYLRLRISAYVGTRENPFDEEEKEDDETTRLIEMYGDVLLYDADGTPVMYLDNQSGRSNGWKSWTGAEKNSYKMIFIAGNDWDSSRVANQWIVNSQETSVLDYAGYAVPLASSSGSKRRQYKSEGDRFPLPPRSGNIEVTVNYAIISDGNDEGPKIYAADKVKHMLLNQVQLTAEDESGDSIDTDDVEFASYINAKVKNDYPEVTLKCISGNEDSVPVGKGNILRKGSSGYVIHKEYRRKDQVDILERLLMCTIHSNYSGKNEQFSSNLNFTKNPIMQSVTYDDVLDGTYIVTGCEINLSEATVMIEAVGFSEDTEKLSDIPYELN